MQENLVKQWNCTSTLGAQDSQTHKRRHRNNCTYNATVMATVRPFFSIWSGDTARSSYCIVAVADLRTHSPQKHWARKELSCFKRLKQNTDCSADMTKDLKPRAKPVGPNIERRLNAFIGPWTVMVVLSMVGMKNTGTRQEKVKFHSYLTSRDFERQSRIPSAARRPGPEGMAFVQKKTAQADSHYWIVGQRSKRKDLQFTGIRHVIKNRITGFSPFLGAFSTLI